MAHGNVGALISIFLAAVAVLSAQSTQRPTPAIVTGHLVDAGGSPVTNAQLELHGWNGQVLGQGLSNGTGNFEFDTNMPGPYQLVVRGTTQDVVIPLTSSGHPGETEVRMPAPKPLPASSGATVSVNDLAAPSKARNKLDDAVKALDNHDYPKALQAVNRAIAIAPNWGHAHFVRGLLEMDSGDYNAAGADLRQAQSVLPDDQATLVALAKYFTITGDPADAQSCLSRALAAPNPSWQAYYEQAYLDLQAGHFAAAESGARNALNDSPPANPSVYFLLAQAEYSQGEMAAAAQNYSRYLQATAADSPGSSQSVALARQRLAAIGHP